MGLSICLVANASLSSVNDIVSQAGAHLKCRRVQLGFCFYQNYNITGQILLSQQRHRESRVAPSHLLIRRQTRTHVAESRLSLSEVTSLKMMSRITSHLKCSYDAA